jgi:hypothetical protein
VGGGPHLPVRGHLQPQSRERGRRRAPALGARVSAGEHDRFPRDALLGERGEPPYEPLAITEVAIHDKIGLFDYVVVVEFPSPEPVDFDVIWDPAKPWLYTIRSNPADPVYWGVGHDDDFPLVLLIHYYPDLTINGISGMDLVFAALEDAHHVGDIPVELTVAGFADNGVETFRLVKEELGSGPIPGPEPATGGPAAALAALAVLCRRRSRARKRARRSPSLRS